MTFTYELICSTVKKLQVLRVCVVSPEDFLSTGAVIHSTTRAERITIMRRYALFNDCMQNRKLAIFGEKLAFFDSKRKYK